MLFTADLLPNGLHEKVMICCICYITKTRLDAQFVELSENAYHIIITVENVIFV